MNDREGDSDNNQSDEEEEHSDLSIDFEGIFNGVEPARQSEEEEEEADNHSVGSVIVNSNGQDDLGKEMTCSVCYESLKELANAERHSLDGRDKRAKSRECDPLSIAS